MGLYRRGFAGDHRQHLLANCQTFAPSRQCRVFNEVRRTKCGADALSVELLDFLVESGVSPVAIARDPLRSMGL